MRAFRNVVLVPLAAALLTACPPPIYPKHRGDYDLAFAKSYFRGRGPSEAGDLAVLTLDQLYAIHRYSLERMHHGPRLFDEFARRGHESAAFLRTKLGQAEGSRAVDALLGLLRGLQRQGVFDPRGDPSLIALIQDAARRHDGKLGLLRDLADTIERNEDLPSTIGSTIRAPWDGRGDDYDKDFARDHCPGCDYHETIASAGELPIERLYALQRFNWEREWPRNYNRYMARRGAEAASFYKAKLASGRGGGEMIWNILSTIELMRDLGTYDVTGDAELMRLAEAAAARAGRWHRGAAGDIVARLKSGARHPLLGVEER